MKRILCLSFILCLFSVNSYSADSCEGLLRLGSPIAANAAVFSMRDQVEKFEFVMNDKGVSSLIEIHRAQLLKQGQALMIKGFGFSPSLRIGNQFEFTIVFGTYAIGKGTKDYGSIWGIANPVGVISFESTLSE